MQTRFVASQSVQIPVAEQPVPIHHYLRQPHRLVQALVDPSRMEQLSEDCFRLKMRPLSFLALSIQPIVDMRVWAESDGTVHLKSIACEIRGIEYINQRFALNLIGKLHPCQINNITHLTGKADLEVKVELPPALWFTPKPFLEATGNSLLKSVLLTIKQRLMHQLLLDYQRWAYAGTNKTILPQSSVLSANSPII